MAKLGVTGDRERCPQRSLKLHAFNANTVLLVLILTRPYRRGYSPPMAVFFPVFLANLKRVLLHPAHVCWFVTRSATSAAVPSRATAIPSLIRGVHWFQHTRDSAFVYSHTAISCAFFQRNPR
jgi:hypothetical protein